MRTCFSCKGEGYFEDDEGFKEDCLTCDGYGEVEDGCYCAAREPFECCCNGWSDVDLDEWYLDDCYDDIFPKAKTRTAVRLCLTVCG